MWTRASTVALCLLACACRPNPGNTDAGVDAGNADAGADAGTEDAGVDAGSTSPSLAVTFACTQPGHVSPPASVEVVWSVRAPLSITSSPRVAELNGDGVADLLIGHGVGVSGAVAAYDGVTGEVLWRTDAGGDVYGSALFLHLDGDDVVDAVMAGRRSTMLAVSGVSGAVMWTFDAGAQSPRDAGWFGFYTPQPVPDVDGDGVIDFVTANGGDDSLAPHEPRPPGHLVVMSGATGAVLARALTPDGAETYMSPLVTTGLDGGLEVIFGTGGETLPGSLWRVAFAALLLNDVSSARQLLGPLGTKGMMAPPSLVDLTHDGVEDLVVATFDGRLVAINGATDVVLWSVTTANSESYATPAIGFFDDDDVPDVAGSFMSGVWEQGYSGSRLFSVSGATGSVLYDVNVPGMVLASPLAFDTHGAGHDSLLYVESGTDEDAGAIVLVDVAAGTDARLATIPRFSFSTPWVGDLDCDGVLDLLYTRDVTPSELDAGEDFVALITRLRLPAAVPARVSWGGYLGSRGDGRFQR